MILIYALGAASLAGWVYLAAAHGRFWMPLIAPPSPSVVEAPSVTIIVPARNEAELLPRSLASLLAQAYQGPWRILLVDDHSGDGTRELAQSLAAGDKRLTVIDAPALPAGWSGKVAALHAGVAHSASDFILFTDADICHAPDSLAHLVARAETAQLDLVSRMVMLHCRSLAEKWLIPAFVFFFAMLYPFRRANSSRSSVAAAAGGTILIRRAMLERIGGLACIKGALIDDCGLARAVKDAGGKTELKLTRFINSIRPYPHVSDIWCMIARTAYTQLAYSPLWLAGTLIGMAVLYVVPLALSVMLPWHSAAVCGAVAWLLMSAIYYPMIKFYGLPAAWALSLPFAALIYSAATFESARLYYLGQGGRWKGRAQARVTV